MSYKTKISIIILTVALLWGAENIPVLTNGNSVSNDLLIDTPLELRTPLTSSQQTQPSILAIPYAIEWRISLPDTYYVGLTTVWDTILWVSEGSATTGTDVPEIYVYNLRTLALIDSFNQPGVPMGWGWRDMTTRGDSVFASYSTSIQVIHAPTRTVARSFTPGTGLNPHRGLAWNPGDSIYATNFASPIWQFYKASPFSPRSVANIDTSYGIGYDANGFLWMSVQTGLSQGKIAKFSYPALIKLDEQLIPEIPGLAGGCEMWRDTFLLYLNQGTPDEVVCIRLYFPANDVGADAVRSPLRAVNPGSSIAPIARIRNFGANPISNIPVTCWIDSAGVRIYNQSLTYPGPLAGGDTARVTFSPNWQVGPAGTNYQVKMFTSLTDDANRANDTTSLTTVSFNIRDTLVIPWRTVVPTVDGNIQTAEWADALIWDISDVLGQNGVARPAGSAIFYCKHDSQNVYYAVAMPPALARNDYDQFGAYVDENYNRAWATDSSEGNHWFTFIGVDTTIYRSLPSGWIRWASGNGLSRVSTVSGHLQFESVVAKGALKWNYTISPRDDTVAFYIYSLDQPGDNYYGMWPTTMPAAQWSNPVYYGTLIFSSSPVTVEEREAITHKDIQICNPLRMPLVLDNISRLEIYDVTGKKITEVKKSGNNDKLVWNGKDRYGKAVPSGIYFLRMKTEQGTFTRKAVYLK